MGESSKVLFVVDSLGESCCEVVAGEAEEVVEGKGGGIVDVGRGESVNCVKEGRELEGGKRLEGDWIVSS
jgi:hypothetical protein